jgi:transposase
MYIAELYARVRRAVLVEGLSQRAVARELGLARKTVRKMLAYSAPPGYQRQKPVRRPKLGPWQGVIDAILEDDKLRPRKQRHTAKRRFERLRAEHGYTGGNMIVKNYVRSSKIGGPDLTYQPLGVPGLNPWRYVSPGVNNPTAYDLWIQLSISGKKYLVSNWSKTVLIDSPLP